MLVDLVLTCAAAAALAPVAVSMWTAHTDFVTKRTAQRRLYRALLLAEKLPPTAAGTDQITADIERQTLHLAYLTQFPHRAKEITAVAALAAAVVLTTAGYLVALWGDAGWFRDLVLLATVVIGALWLNRVVRNFTHNEALTRELFATLRAPATLRRPRTELAAKGPTLTAGELLRRAADIRDGALPGTPPLSTPEAVNAALAAAHTHDLWRRELAAAVRLAVDTDYPELARSTAVKGFSMSVAAYHWSLRHLLGPYFDIRLDYLNDRERRRTEQAQRTGDVFRAAWLAGHYRNERDRLAVHWAHVAGAGEALTRMQPRMFTRR